MIHDGGFLIGDRIVGIPDSTCVIKNVECELEDSILRYYNKSMVWCIHINAIKSSYKDMKFENDIDAVKMIVVFYIVLVMIDREKTRAYVNLKCSSM